MQRQAVLGDMQERGAFGWRELLDLVSLVFVRQLRTWTSWSPWLTSGLSLLPVYGVLSPSFSIAFFLSQRTEPGASPVDSHALGLVFWGGVGTLIMAWAVGFTLSHWARNCVMPVVPTLAIVSLVVCWDDVLDAAGSGILVTTLYVASALVLVVIPGMLGLERGFRRDALQLRSAVSLALVGILTTGMLVASTGGFAQRRWDDCLALPLAWPVLYAISTARTRFRTYTRSVV
jgi:hypothetical protein